MVHDGSSFLVPGIFCFNNMGCGACSHAHDLNLEEGNVIGNFNGEFWGMFAGYDLRYHTRASYKRGMLKERRLYQILLSVSALPLFDLRMLLIIPLIAYSGLQQAFVWAECTKYIAEPALGESGVGGAMAAYGAFDAIVIVTSGVLGILYPLLMAAALGIGDGIFNTQLNALLGMLFKHDMRRSICTAQGLAMCFDRNCVFSFSCAD
ncbi:unnamed protein product [Camellia sinensis]